MHRSFAELDRLVVGGRVDAEDHVGFRDGVSRGVGKCGSGSLVERIGKRGRVASASLHHDVESVANQPAHGVRRESHSRLADT